jgi:sugar phosphate permease
VAAGAEWPSPGYAWYVVFVLMVAYTLSYIDRTIVDLLVGPIKADLGLTDTQFSLLRGLAFAVFYTLLGIPLGQLADRCAARHGVSRSCSPPAWPWASARLRSRLRPTR